MSEQRQREIAARQRCMHRRQEEAQARMLLSHVRGLTVIRFLGEAEEEALPVVYDRIYWRAAQPFARLPHDSSAADVGTWLQACVAHIGLAAHCYLKLPGLDNAPWAEVAVERSGAWLVALWEQVTDHDDLRIVAPDTGRILVIEDLEWEYAAYWLDRRGRTQPVNLDDYVHLWTDEAGEWVLLGTSEGEFPVHWPTHMGLIIEDDDVAQEVKKRMSDAGVPIVQELPE